jgi:membrane peptidoglycan carboxypeptidase
VRGDDGEPLVTGDNCTPEAIPRGVADTLNQMLRKDVEPGNPGQTAPRAYVPGHQIAGKTGTTQNNYSVAFVGYTPEIAASVMVFNPKETEDVGGFGGGKGATIWHDAMAPILQARGSGVFRPADPAVVNGNTRPVPRCDSVQDCVEALRDAGFQSTVAQVDSDKEAGAFLGTSPGRAGRAVPGQVVTIRVSNGSGYVPPPPSSSAPVPTPTLPVPTTEAPEDPPELPGTPTLPGSVPPTGTRSVVPAFTGVPSPGR